VLDLVPSDEGLWCNSGMAPRTPDTEWGNW